jgi:hypothetical protein
MEKMEAAILQHFVAAGPLLSGWLTGCTGAATERPIPERQGARRLTLCIAFLLLLPRLPRSTQRLPSKTNGIRPELMEFRTQGSTTTLSHRGFSDYSIWAVKTSTSASIYDSLQAIEFLRLKTLVICMVLYGRVGHMGVQILFTP